MNPINILHITPHLGGGVGTVLVNYLLKTKRNNSIKHKVISLDYANEEAIRTLHNNNINLLENISKQTKIIHEQMQYADVVLVHWWNHPLIYQFLINHELPSCRMIIWSHASCLYPPYVFSEKLINFSDMFVFTSPVSYKAREIKALPDKLKQKLRVIWSTGGFEHLENIQHQEHENFIVGFTGTVDYNSKLHPEYIKMCANINIDNVKFIVCSVDSQKQVKNDAIRMGVIEKFSFEGRVPSIIPYLSIFDVFGYPLSPYHYGTCEQSIGEAMIAGVVPVVLANESEKYIVDDGVTGIIAKNTMEYSRAIEYLYNNNEVRKTLSNNAKKVAKEKYSMNKKINAWENAFEDILKQPKTEKRWDIADNQVTGAYIFSESLGNYGKIFKSYINTQNPNEKIVISSQIKEMFNSSTQWNSENKGSIKQYSQFFPDDKNLQEWVYL